MRGGRSGKRLTAASDARRLVARGYGRLVGGRCGGRRVELYLYGPGSVETGYVDKLGARLLTNFL